MKHRNPDSLETAKSCKVFEVENGLSNHIRISADEENLARAQKRDLWQRRSVATTRNEGRLTHFETGYEMVEAESTEQGPSLEVWVFKASADVKDAWHSGGQLDVGLIVGS